MRSTLSFIAGLLLATSAHAIGLADISGKDANGGLKEALTQGAGKAVDLLGRKDGFMGNAKVKIPLPPSVQKQRGSDCPQSASRRLDSNRRDWQRKRRSP